MPVIGAVATWLAGWLAFRLLTGRDVRLNSLSIGTAWALGTGVVYALHYLFILMARANPPALLVFGVAALGLAFLLRERPELNLPLAAMLRHEGPWGGLLLAALVLMTFLTAILGFGNDAVLLWLGRARGYAALPDYLFHLGNYPFHPSYPPLMIHQYQWQLRFGDGMFGLKLPTLLFYFVMVLTLYHVLRTRVRAPAKWTLLAALLPMYLVYVPGGLIDTALSVFALLAVAWLLEPSPDAIRRPWVIAALLGLMPVVKNEGIVLAACLIFSLVIVAIREPSYRGTLRVVLRASLPTIALIAGSWFGLWLVARPEESDFSLARFDLGNVDEIVVGLLRVLFDPRQFNAVWLIIIAAVVLSQGKRLRIVWLSALLYAAVMLIAYFFSNYGGSPADHVFDSYGRLLQQVLPLGMIALATIIGTPPESGATAPVDSPQMRVVTE